MKQGGRLRPCVPTGINRGVWHSKCGNVSRDARALLCRASTCYEKNTRDDIEIHITQHPQNPFNPLARKKSHTVTHSHALKNFWGAHPQGSLCITKYSLRQRDNWWNRDWPTNATNPFIPYDFNSKSYKTRETTFKFPLLSIRKHHFNRLERNKFTYSYAFNFLRSPATGIITHRQNWLCQRDHHRIKIDRQCSPKPLHLTTISIPNRSKEQERRKFEFPSLCIRKITPTNLQKSIHTYQYAFKFLRNTPTEIITHRQNWLCQRDQHRKSSLTNNAPPILHNFIYFLNQKNSTT